MLRKEEWVIDSTDMGEDGLDLGKRGLQAAYRFGVHVAHHDPRAVARESLRGSKITTNKATFSHAESGAKVPRPAEPCYLRG